MYEHGLSINRDVNEIWLSLAFLQSIWKIERERSRMYERLDYRCSLESGCLVETKCMAAIYKGKLDSFNFSLCFSPEGCLWEEFQNLLTREHVGLYIEKVHGRWWIIEEGRNVKKWDRKMKFPLEWPRWNSSDQSVVTCLAWKSSPTSMWETRARILLVTRIFFRGRDVSKAACKLCTSSCIVSNTFLTQLVFILLVG